jgi:hypothetical protein
MIVLFGLIFQAFEPFGLHRFIEPLIVAPVRHHAYRIRRHDALTEERVDGIGSSTRVPGEPQLRILGTDRRTQDVEGRL